MHEKQNKTKKPLEPIEQSFAKEQNRLVVMRAKDLPSYKSLNCEENKESNQNKMYRMRQNFMLTSETSQDQLCYKIKYAS